MVLTILVPQKIWKDAYASMKMVITLMRIHIPAALYNSFGVRSQRHITKPFNGNIASKAGAAPKRKH